MGRESLAWALVAAGLGAVDVGGQRGGEVHARQGRAGNLLVTERAEAAAVFKRQRLGAMVSGDVGTRNGGRCSGMGLQAADDGEYPPDLTRGAGS